MAKRKYHIVAMKNGQAKGYIKAVSYSRGTFSLTQNIESAKGYTSEDIIHNEIDFLTSVGFAYGYVFIYS